MLTVSILAQIKYRANRHRALDLEGAGLVEASFPRVTKICDDQNRGDWGMLV